MVHSGNKGHGRAWAYNETLRRVALAKPGCKFDWLFLHGRLNVQADRLSRGESLPDLCQSLDLQVRIDLLPPNTYRG